MMKLIEILDPETYGLNRSAIALGIVALGVGIVICSKLLEVLHEAGLPELP